MPPVLRDRSNRRAASSGISLLAEESGTGTQTSSRMNKDAKGQHRDAAAELLSQVEGLLQEGDQEQRKAIFDHMWSFFYDTAKRYSYDLPTVDNDPPRTHAAMPTRTKRDNRPTLHTPPLDVAEPETSSRRRLSTEQIKRSSRANITRNLKVADKDAAADHNEEKVPTRADARGAIRNPGAVLAKASLEVKEQQNECAEEGSSQLTDEAHIATPKAHRERCPPPLTNKINKLLEELILPEGLTPREVQDRLIRFRETVVRLGKLGKTEMSDLQVNQLTEALLHPYTKSGLMALNQFLKEAEPLESLHSKIKTTAQLVQLAEDMKGRTTLREFYKGMAFIHTRVPTQGVKNTGHVQDNITVAVYTYWQYEQVFNAIGKGAYPEADGYRDRNPEDNQRWMIAKKRSSAAWWLLERHVQSNGDVAVTRHYKDARLYASAHFKVVKFAGYWHAFTVPENSWSRIQKIGGRKLDACVAHFKELFPELYTATKLMGDILWITRINGLPLKPVKLEKCKSMEDVQRIFCEAYREMATQLEYKKLPSTTQSYLFNGDETAGSGDEDSENEDAENGDTNDMNTNQTATDETDGDPNETGASETDGNANEMDAETDANETGANETDGDETDGDEDINAGSDEGN